MIDKIANAIGGLIDGQCSPSRQAAYTGRIVAQPCRKKAQSWTSFRANEYDILPKTQQAQLPSRTSEEVVRQGLRRLPTSARIKRIEEKRGTAFSGGEVNIIDVYYDEPHKLKINATQGKYHMKTLNRKMIRLSEVKR